MQVSNYRNFLRGAGEAGCAVAAKVPALLIVSEQDKMVTPKHTLGFVDQLEAGGVRVTTVSVPGTWKRVSSRRVT